MKLHQLAEQTGVKTIQLIEIAKASGLLNFHGGTVLTAEQQTQIASIYRYMLALKVTDPAAAIAQMNAGEALCADGSTVNGSIAISIQPSVADELYRRYPAGTMSDRILKALGALHSFEQLYTSIFQQRRVSPIGLADELVNSEQVSIRGLSGETRTIPSA